MVGVLGFLTHAFLMPKQPRCDLSYKATGVYPFLVGRLLVTNGKNVIILQNPILFCIKVPGQCEGSVLEYAARKSRTLLQRYLSKEREDEAK